MQENQIPKDKNIKLFSMYDEMSSSYLSYAMSVIISRAFLMLEMDLNLYIEELFMLCIKVVLIGLNNSENQQE